MLEAAALSAPVGERQIRRDVLVESLPRVVNPDHHQPLGVWVRKRPEQHAIDDAEDCRICADTQRQGQDRQGSKERLFQKTTYCVTKVMNHG